MLRTTIVIPCYNEAQRLDVDALAAYDEPGVTLLLVDDGSADDTRAVADRLAAAAPDRIRVLGLERNGGKAEAVRRGFLDAFESGAEVVGFWDADLATPLSDIVGFRDLLEERPDLEMVFGSRVNLLGRRVRRNLARHYIGRVFATAAAAALRLPIYDTQCGAKMFRVTDDLREVFETPFLSRWIFDVEIVARLLQRRRGTDLPRVRDVIFEQPLMQWEDVKGSKLRPFDFMTVGLDLLRIRMRYGG